MTEIRLAIIGLGQWGKNYVRLFSHIPGAKIVRCCDVSRDRFDQMRPMLPEQVEFDADPRSIFQDRTIDAVILASPSSTHYTLGLAALKSGKDLLVEKPMALEPRQAAAMVKAARRLKRVLMVGHTFLFHPVIRKMKEYLRKRYLGRPYYFHSQRTNLGPIRSDVNTVLDLAPHDISILLHLLESMPEKIQAVGASFLNKGIEDAVSLILHFPRGIKAFIHVSWLEPLKMRRLIAVGEKRMMLFNDMNDHEPLRIYNKYVTGKTNYDDFAEYKTIVRDGDVRIPYIPAEEPLRNECRAFLDAVRARKVRLSDGAFGLQVVQVLHACQKSLSQNGRLVSV